MTTFQSTVPTLQITIGFEHITQTVNWLMQTGIHFSIQYSPGKLQAEDKAQGLDSSSEAPDRPANEMKANSIPEKTNTLDNVLNRYILKGTTPPMEEISKALGMKAAEFKANFKKENGKTFYRYYMEKKMEYAAKLLKQGYTGIEVSEKIGYSSPIKFNKTFQKYFEITPKKYQIQHRPLASMKARY